MMSRYVPFQALPEDKKTKIQKSINVLLGKETPIPANTLINRYETEDAIKGLHSRYCVCGRF